MMIGWLHTIFVAKSNVLMFILLNRACLADFFAVLFVFLHLKRILVIFDAHGTYRVFDTIDFLRFPLLPHRHRNDIVAYLTTQ